MDELALDTWFENLEYYKKLDLYKAYKELNK